MSTAKPATNRIASLDQFRGYTVAGMFVVNFLGAYVATPLVLKHHNNFCSYADTIMPQFFFAVGFAFRLTFGRRAQTQGVVAAYGHVVRRLLGLALVAIVIYHAPTVSEHWNTLVEKGFWEALRKPLKGTWFQTLMHIAVTSLWITPVIRASAPVRIAFMIASAVLQVVLSYWFYFDWVQTGCIDGGPLGFLTWTFPTIVGTLACDAVTAPDGPQIRKMFVWSALLMGLGYLLSCPTTLYDVPDDQVASLKQEIRPADAVLPSRERLDTHPLSWAEPPFVPPPDSDHRKENYWMMSQRAATISYHVFGAGLALAVYALFYIACDIWGWQLGLFRTLGTNALVGYILHGIVGDSVEAFVPRDSPGWYVTGAFLLYFGITYLFIRHLEKNKIYLKL
ncbi:MAG TPA: heparan-alpha-glucosaminide N-acetyltransferase domain-containing protein [Pirellulales bacterium]|nr:heparan-alpha-glucosaminide N-acetyltransferase domain-containing protein [Pirellulales bacterium]